MSSKIKVDTIENVAGSGNVSLGSGHNLVVPGNQTVGGLTTLNGKFLIDGSNNDLMTFRTTGDTASQVLGLQFQNNSEAVTAQMFGTGDNSSNGVFRIKGIGNVDIVTADVGVNGNPGTLSVKHGGDVHVGGGDLVFATSGKGIVLGATSNTDANTLDDFEEGTWTPTVNTATGYSAQYGKYVKIGKMVWLNGNVNTSSTSAAGHLIQGLPFASGNTGNSAGNLSIGYYSGVNVPMVWFSGYVLNNSTEIYIAGNANGHTGSTIQYNGASVFSGNSRIMFSVVYEAAA